MSTCERRYKAFLHPSSSAILAFQTRSPYIFPVVFRQVEIETGAIMKRYYPLILVLFGMSAIASLTNAQYLTTAKLALQQMQFEKAEASAMIAVEKDPEDADAWFVLGKARFALHKYPQMIEA
ncbi:MAG TPA: hypothetical protein DGH68_09805, partial [Bacteroidetes bacterium]|nr:hypothetical protein [Bacteroidota bacterium]